MKKIVSRIALCGMAALLAVSLSACTPSAQSPSSASSKAAASTPSSSEASSKAAVSSAVSSGAAAGFPTVADFINSKEVQEQLMLQKGALEDQPYTVDMVAEGNALVYIFSFKDEMDTTGVADQLKAGLEAQASTFEMILSSLQETVAIDGLSVIVRYTDNQGNEIFSQEYK